VGTIVERSFQTTVPDAFDLPDFVSYLKRHKGVEGVTPDRGRATVRIRYDVRRLNFADVQDLLAQAGAPALQGYCQRWRSGWFVNLDTNIRDNAAHRPVCCSKPPPGAGDRAPKRGGL
jgi:hypothetical protein